MDFLHTILCTQKPPLLSRTLLFYAIFALLAKGYTMCPIFAHHLQRDDNVFFGFFLNILLCNIAIIFAMLGWILDLDS